MNYLLDGSAFAADPLTKSLLWQLHSDKDYWSIYDQVKLYIGVGMNYIRKNHLKNRNTVKPRFTGPLGGKELSPVNREARYFGVHFTLIYAQSLFSGDRIKAQ